MYQPNVSINQLYQPTDSGFHNHKREYRLCSDQREKLKCPNIKDIPAEERLDLVEVYKALIIY